LIGSIHVKGVIRLSSAEYEQIVEKRKQLDGVYEELGKKYGKMLKILDEAKSTPSALGI
jgi:hypothetical protein